MRVCVCACVCACVCVGGAHMSVCLCVYALSSALLSQSENNGVSALFVDFVNLNFTLGSMETPRECNIL